MGVMSKSCVLVGALLVAATTLVEPTAATAANPIRKVVGMLRKMETKVVEEGKAQKEVFEKYMCYCETNQAVLGKTVSDLSDKIPQVEATIKEATSQSEQLKSDLVQAKSDRGEAQKAIDKATAMRDKEAKDFQSESGDMKANLLAMSKAIPAIEKGMGDSFLQSTEGARVRQLLSADSVTFSPSESDSVQSFLQGGSSSGSETSGSGEIVGVLKQMQADMQKDLDELVGQENSAIASHAGLVLAKVKEITQNSKMIEEKTARLGTTEVELANAKHDLEDTAEMLAQDQGFLADLTKGCKVQEGAWEQVQKARQTELGAIAETIKLLNSDDALDLFKKALPAPAEDGASFVQLSTSMRAARTQAAAHLRMAARSDRKHAGQLNLIALAIHGKKAGFAKVLQMIDGMFTVLKNEQKDDDAQKAFCTKELDVTEDKMKEGKRDVANLNTAVGESEDSMKTLAAEVQELEDGIKALDLSVAVATMTRKQEHKEFVEELAQNNAAIELLEMAKNRMNKFYNPKLYRAPQTPTPTEEQRQYFAATGEVPPELTEPPMPTGAFVQMRSSTSDMEDAAPPPPPATMAAFKKGGEESNGVIGMMTSIINDVKAEVSKAKFEETEAQKDYEQLTADSASKRQEDAKSITDKETAKSEVESELQRLRDNLAESNTQLMQTMGYLADLHSDCDFLINNFDTRKVAREDEKEALNKAKAVLNGADYSFVQAQASTHFMQIRQRVA